MPYKIVHRGGKACVVNKDTGKTEKCHDSDTAAEKHMAALYTNVHKSPLDEFVGVSKQRVGASGNVYVRRSYSTSPNGQRMWTVSVSSSEEHEFDDEAAAMTFAAGKGAIVKGAPPWEANPFDRFIKGGT